MDSLLLSLIAKGVRTTIALGGETTSTVGMAVTGDDLLASVAEVIHNAGGLSVAPGERVLIKPNLVEPASYRTAKVTNPHLVGAIAKWCLERGAGEILIGEGPGWYVTAQQMKACFTESGMKEVADRVGARCVLFDEHPFRIFDNASRFLPSQFGVTRFAFDCDKLINVPAMKSHIETRVSLAMKNLKGCLRQEDKLKFHRVGLFRAIVELNRIVRPDFNIVDGTMRNASGVLVASEDVVAVDAVASSLMGIEPGEVETIELGAQAGLGEADLTRMNLVGGHIKRLRLKFRMPREELRRHFPKLELKGTDKACSGCVMPLMGALLTLAQEGKRITEPLCLVMGEGTVPMLGMLNLFVGDCTAGLGPEQPDVPGCPLDQARVLEVLRKTIC